MNTSEEPSNYARGNELSSVIQMKMQLIFFFHSCLWSWKCSAGRALYFPLGQKYFLFKVDFLIEIFSPCFFFFSKIYFGRERVLVG